MRNGKNKTTNYPTPVRIATRSEAKTSKQRNRQQLKKFMHLSIFVENEIGNDHYIKQKFLK